MGHWGYVSTDADIPYPAWIDDRHWNGFAMPFFTRDVVDRVIADTDGWARFAVEDGVPTVRTTDDDPSCSVDDVAIPLVEVDGVTLYGIGAGSWVWGEVVGVCSDCGAQFPVSDMTDLTRPDVYPVPVLLCADCARDGGAS